MSVRTASRSARTASEVTEKYEINRDESPCANYIGVYWTFPAPGRYGLPTAADEAARVSFTIDEQRRRISREALRRGYTCVGEYTVQYNEPDISEDDRTRLREIESICEDGSTLILLTNFTTAGNWRANTQLYHILKNTGVPVSCVEPSGAVIDHFNLNRHWERCQRHIRKWPSKVRAAVRDGKEPPQYEPPRVNKAIADKFYEYVEARLKDIRDLDVCENSKIADRFNSLNVYTLYGQRWDANEVKMLRAKLHRRFVSQSKPSSRSSNRSRGQ